jgi:uncharacterized RmlC-like cupin family protein
MMDETTSNLPPDQEQSEIIIVHSDATSQTRQQIPYFVGISATTAGATGISMNLAMIPPGGTAEPHSHAHHETAIYLLKGRVETRYGRGLKQTKIAEAGDFIFVPPNVPHQPRNLSPDEPAYALVARNDPNEQENIVLYNPTLESDTNLM